MKDQISSSNSALIRNRFKPSRSVLFVDAVMNHFIKFGGILVIAAVFGIFVFIASQIIPLFKGASVALMDEIALSAPAEGAGRFLILGVDEGGKWPFLVDDHGRVFFVSAEERGQLREYPIPFAEIKTISAVTYLPAKQQLVFGTTDGFFCVAAIGWKAASRKPEDGEQRMDNPLQNPSPSIAAGPWIAIAPADSTVLEIAYSDSGARRLAAAIVQQGEQKKVLTAAFAQKRSLLSGSGGVVSLVGEFDLTPNVSGDPFRVLVNAGADQVLVATRDGGIDFFSLVGSTFVHQQRFAPFGDLKDKRIASMDFLLGDVSVVLTNAAGENRIFSLFIPKGGDKRVYGQTKQFPVLKGGADFFASGLRNRTFLIGHGKEASLRYGTTEAIRWEKELPFSIQLARISGKQDKIFFLDDRSVLHVYSLRDPHPETSFKALFGRVWYEGASEPQYAWQSTGGSDEFEPKLSMIPLIFGTLKGTLYAMVFALPIALLAGIYTSQFLRPKIRQIVKPTMEIMASLPSVVLGFLAALWLAPLVENRVPSILCVLLLLIVTSALSGWLLSMLPLRWRRYLKPGFEFLVFFPIFVLICWVGWELGPILERIFFVVRDPETGVAVADFRRWWPEVTHTPYEQRNSLVVGFMMGFAVIPIIFTITEDALSNVPGALKSASLACGASRWQTTLYVVIPTAAAGIFSAMMIGLGRAVGETMIVVMATGNTPIMDLNIFSGMRTLSANIAVELPEAPHNGTLYRTLFLGAMLLFLMTFVINTIAEILRQHLREKFKTI